MTQDSCNYGQRDGKECGRFPTCKKGGGAPPTDNGKRLKISFFGVIMGAWVAHGVHGLMHAGRQGVLNIVSNF
jgi:hypothetical protein